MRLAAKTRPTRASSLRRLVLEISFPVFSSKAFIPSTDHVLALLPGLHCPAFRAWRFEGGGGIFVL